MQRRKATEKKRPHSRTRKAVPRTSKVRVETKKLDTGTQASKLPSARLPRSPKTLRVLTGDLTPEDLNNLIKEDSLAVDTETGGLDFRTCDLRLITICTRAGDVILVRKPTPGALNLRRLFNSDHISFVFHHAAFDLKFIVPHLGISMVDRFECTKTLSKVLEPGEKSGLGKVVKRTCGIEIDKAIKHTWDEQELSKRQVEYACDDVLYLHEVLDYFRVTLCDGKHSDSASYYKAALDCISTMATLDITGFANVLYYADDEPGQIKANRLWWAYKSGEVMNSMMMHALDEVEVNKKKYQILGNANPDGTWDVFAKEGDEDVRV